VSLSEELLSDTLERGVDCHEDERFGRPGRGPVGSLAPERTLNSRVPPLDGLPRLENHRLWVRMTQHLQTSSDESWQAARAEANSCLLDSPQ
jgi:hypothetical protein